MAPKFSFPHEQFQPVNDRSRKVACESEAAICFVTQACSEEHILGFSISVKDVRLYFDVVCSLYFDFKVFEKWWMSFKLKLEMSFKFRFRICIWKQNFELWVVSWLWKRCVPFLSSFDSNCLLTFCYISFQVWFKCVFVFENIWNIGVVVSFGFPCQFSFTLRC